MQPTAPIYCVCGVRSHAVVPCCNGRPVSYLGPPGQSPREYIARYRNMYPVPGVGYTGTLMAARVQPQQPAPPQAGPITLVGHAYSPYLLLIPPAETA